MDNKNSRLFDKSFNISPLSIDEQLSSSDVDSIKYLERLKAIVLGEEKPNIIIDKPLTVDIYSRGYKPTEKEIETIRRINDMEQDILDNEPDRKNYNNGYEYFITEDGRIIKIKEDATYIFDIDSKEWEEASSIKDELENIRYSKLFNFRDYYNGEEFEFDDSKYRNSLLGFVVGDALGVPVEFKKRFSLDKDPVKDMIGDGTHNKPKGTFSDDTSMTLAELDSIKECGDINFIDIMNKFVLWMTSGEYTSTGDFFDIGNTTRDSLERFLKGAEPVNSGGKEQFDNGNGSLMRMLPFVLYSHYKGLTDEEETELINQASSLTHAHEVSRLGCKIYTDFLEQILGGSSKEEALEFITSKDYSDSYSGYAISNYKKVLDGSIVKADRDMINSSGYVVSTLEASLWCLFNSNSYEEAVLKAVNLGDDTDTVAAITGSMAGALYEDVPDKWISNINNIELVNNIYDGFMDKIESKSNEQDDIKKR